MAAALPSLGGAFVWDDRWLILQSPLRHDPGLLPRLLIEGHGWGTMTMPEDATVYYRPLATLLHGIMILIFGPNPLPFRVVSIGLHAASSVLLGLFLARRAPRAAAAALVFAVHPALADAYGWISATPDLLAAGFLISTLVFLDRRRGTLAGLCWFLGLMSKESAIVGALWIPLLTICGVIERPGRRSWIALGAALGLYLAVRALTVGFERGAVEYPAGVAAGGLVLAGRLFIADVFRLLVPVRLTLEAPVWVTARGSGAGGIAGIVLMVALAGAAWVLLRRTGGAVRGLALSYLLCLAALLPVLQIVPTNDIFGGRFLVLPAMGLCMGLGLAIAWIRGPIRRTVVVAFAALILLMGVRTGLRAGEWVSEERLFGGEFRRQPDCIRARLSWASYLISAGRIAEAAPVIEGTRALLPDHPRVRYQQALLWMNQGRVDEAEAAFRDLLTNWKRTPTLLANLAGCQMRLGRIEEGLATLDEATRISAPTPGMRNNRGIALMRLGRTGEARREFEAAVAEDPGYAPARVNLIFLLARDREAAPAARGAAEEFLRLFPGAPEAARVRALVDTLGTGGRR
jgi:Flp pilus assembly protein TadD